MAAVELVTTNFVMPAFSAWRKTFSEPSIAVCDRQCQCRSSNLLVTSYVEHGLRINSRRQGRRSVDHRVDTHKRFVEFAAYDVGNLDNLDSWVRAVQFSECGHLLSARRCADAVTAL